MSEMNADRVIQMVLPLGLVVMRTYDGVNSTVIR
jgi:hypothetical protein